MREARKLFNDAGVTIYAYKPDGIQKNLQTTDEEFDYIFSVAATLGVYLTHYLYLAGKIAYYGLLFAGTVMDNIRFSKPDATDDEVVNAARMAEIMEDQDVILNF